MKNCWVDMKLAIDRGEVRWSLSLDELHYVYYVDGRVLRQSDPRYKTAVDYWIIYELIEECQAFYALDEAWSGVGLPRGRVVLSRIGLQSLATELEAST